jgi:hypothetical protein
MQVNLLAFMRVYLHLLAKSSRNGCIPKVGWAQPGRIRGRYSPLDAGSCLGAALGPPLETPTIAGRSTRSPIVQPL